jgi:excisionase family DNA binding protein
MHHYGDMSTFIGTAEAASLLGVDRSTLTRWVKAEKITPAITAPGYRGANLFDPADVLALTADTEVGS